MDILSKLEGGEAQMGLLPAGGDLPGPLVEAARFEWEGPLNAANPRTTHAHIMTFAFRYPTDSAATEAYRLIVDAVGGAPDSAPRELISTILLGDERAAFTRAGLDGREDVVYVWRRAAIVLAIIGHDGSDPSAVVSIALRMDERAG